MVDTNTGGFSEAHTHELEMCVRTDKRKEESERDQMNVQKGIRSEGQQQQHEFGTPNIALDKLKSMHVRQRAQWDCGLACISMVLSKHDIGHTYDMILKRSKDMGLGESIWTIDLLRLLVTFGVPQVVMYTAELGVKPTYKGEAFYLKGFEVDEQRVNNIFRNAANLGLNIEHSRLSLGDLQLHLSRQGIAIVLIDASLYKKASDANTNRTIWSDILNKFWYYWIINISSGDSKSGFIGHYVVVTAFDESSDVFQYLDPASDEPLHTIDIDSFEGARDSFGTDCDIILIPPLAL